MYDLKVDDNKLEIKSVPISDLAGGSVDAIVAFTITGAAPDVLPGIPHLCLDIVGTGTGL